MRGAETPAIPVSAVVLTYNEEKNLGKCLQSLAGRVAEIVVVDSFSTDGTLDIARKFTPNIIQHKYEGHPQQWDWTLRNVSLANDWVFAIDADFVVTNGVWEDLERKLSVQNPSINGFYVRHREIFRGKPISHGGVYPGYWLRIFRKDRVKIDLHELVDIHFYVEGTVGRIEFDVEEQNYKDDNISFWIQKQNNFARKHALEEIKRKNAAIRPPVPPRLFGTPDQRKLMLKSLWYRLPLYLRPFIYFAYRYIFRLGFLDGKEGFIYHFTQGFLYRLLVDINIDEIMNQKAT